MRSIGVAGLGLVAVLVVTGCLLEPRIARNRQPAYSVARYSFAAGGQVMATAEVRPNGQFIFRDSGGYRGGIDIALRMQNSSATPLVLDAHNAWLDVTSSDGQIHSGLPLAQMAGENSVAANATEDVRLYFNLPRGVSALSVRAYRLSWSVHLGQTAIRRRTAFIAIPRDDGIEMFYHTPLEQRARDGALPLPRQQAYLHRVVL